jgi:hypothetical protein
VCDRRTPRRQAYAGTRKSGRRSPVSGAPDAVVEMGVPQFSIFLLLIGGAFGVAGIGHLMRGSRLDSQIASLENEGDRAKGRCGEIEPLENRLASIHLNREKLNSLLTELPARRPSSLLGAAG